MILLDNVDTAVGHDFLDELIMARRQRAAYTDDDPDPLTVVATSRGDLAKRVRLRGESAVTLTGAGYADYLARSQTHIGRWWYPVLLPDLTLDEVGNVVCTLELPGGTRRAVTSAVHRFTAGHPGATRMMLDAIAERPDNPADLLALLARPEPGVLAPRGPDRRGKPAQPAHRKHPPRGRSGPGDMRPARSEEAALRLAAESGLLTDMRGENSVLSSIQSQLSHGSVRGRLRRDDQTRIERGTDGEPKAGTTAWYCLLP